jgi:hypothetical protein
MTSAYSSMVMNSGRIVSIGLFWYLNFEQVPTVPEIERANKPRRRRCNTSCRMRVPPRRGCGWRLRWSAVPVRIAATHDCPLRPSPEPY